MADSTSTPELTCDVEGTCYCPLTGVIDTLSKKYAMQLISIIGVHDSLRFGEIEGHLPAASTTISARLSNFQDAGLVTRTQYDEIRCGLNTRSLRMVMKFGRDSNLF